MTKNLLASKAEYFQTIVMHMQYKQQYIVYVETLCKSETFADSVSFDVKLLLLLNACYQITASSYKSVTKAKRS